MTNDRASHGVVARDGSGRDGVTHMKCDGSGRDMYEVRRDGSGHDGVTRMQSGVMTGWKKMSRVALLNSNITNVYSPTFGSRPDNMYMATNIGGTCKS